MPPKLSEMDNDGLCEWLKCFVFEVRKENGEEYSEVSIHQLICGLQQYLRENGRPELDLFSDKCFSSLCKAVDSKMKALRRAGRGMSNQSDVISQDEEEIFWAKRLLGDSSPDVLRDTLVWMCGLYFALRGGSEL